VFVRAVKSNRLSCAIEFVEVVLPQVAFDTDELIYPFDRHVGPNVVIKFDRSFDERNADR